MARHEERAARRSDRLQRRHPALREVWMPHAGVKQHDRVGGFEVRICEFAPLRFYGQALGAPLNRSGSRWFDLGANERQRPVVNGGTGLEQLGPPCCGPVRTASIHAIASMAWCSTQVEGRIPTQQ